MHLFFRPPAECGWSVEKRRADGSREWLGASSSLREHLARQQTYCCLIACFAALGGGFLDASPNLAKFFRMVSSLLFRFFVLSLLSRKEIQPIGARKWYVASHPSPCESTRYKTYPLYSSRSAHAKLFVKIVTAQSSSVKYTRSSCSFSSIFKVSTSTYMLSTACGLAVFYKRVAGAPSPPAAFTSPFLAWGRRYCGLFSKPP